MFQTEIQPLRNETDQRFSRNFPFDNKLLLLFMLALFYVTPQQIFTSLNAIIESLEKGVRYAQI